MMIKQLFASLAWMSILLSAPACNSDVFLDEPDIPEETSLTLQGDGGEATMSIPTKALKCISLDLMSDEEKYCTYYNLQNEPVGSDVAPSQLGSIVFETNFVALKIIKNGSQITIRSICNTIEFTYHYTLRLEYDYGTRFINFDVTSGQPMILDGIDYDPQLHVTDDGRIVTSHTRYTNNSSLPQTIGVMPYLNSYAATLVEPDRDGAWAKYETLTMKVPVYNDGTWALVEREGVKIGETLRYSVPDQMMKVPVTVPANSEVEIIKKVIFTAARNDGTITYENLQLGKRLKVNFTTTSYYPVDYEIRVENVK